MSIPESDVFNLLYSRVNKVLTKKDIIEKVKNDVELMKYIPNDCNMNEINRKNYLTLIHEI